MSGIRKTTVARYDACARRLSAHGYTLLDSGVVRGELRWYSIKRGTRTVFETPSMVLLERQVRKLCPSVPPASLPAPPSFSDIEARVHAVEAAARKVLDAYNRLPTPPTEMERRLGEALRNVLDLMVKSL